MQLKHGIFDEASISVVASDMCANRTTLGRGLDMRRFRPMLWFRLLRSGPFQEDKWLTVGSHSVKGTTTLLPSRSRCATNAARGEP
jgi:hypothetical protein